MEGGDKCAEHSLTVTSLARRQEAESTSKEQRTEPSIVR